MVSKLLDRDARHLIPALIFLSIGFILFAGAGHDDAHITYWPAHTLATRGEMVNYDGQRIEQSSSLAQVVTVAALVRVTGSDVVTVGRLSAILAGLLTLFATQAWVARCTDASAGRWAGALVATCACFDYWSFGGLDSAYFTLGIALTILTWGALLREPRPAGAGAWLLAVLATAFACTTRPEAPIVLACMLGAVLAVRLLRDPGAWRTTLRTPLGLAAVLLACAGALVAFRLAYFGAPVPNSVSAKVGASTLLQVYEGLRYLIQTIGDQPLLTGLFLTTLVAAGSVAVAAPDRRRPMLDPHLELAAAATLAYLAFIVLVGGDWMGGYRFLAHLSPTLLAVAVVVLYGRGIRERTLKRVIGGAIAVQLITLPAYASAHSLAVPPQRSTPSLGSLAARYTWFERRSQVNLRDMPLLLQLERVVDGLHERLGRPVTVMSGQGGFVFFHLAQDLPGETRFIDRVGLLDRDLGRCPALADLPRFQYGIHMEYRDYYARADRIASECGVARPDVIFDLKDPVEQGIESGGYRLVYFQDGWVMGLHTMSLAVRVAAKEWIAVREDLFPPGVSTEPDVVLFQPGAAPDAFLRGRLDRSAAAQQEPQTPQ